jgi:parallel beta-helix repeat protein
LAIRRIVLAFAALAAALSLSQAASAARVPSSRVPCGATITADTVLRADVTGCAGSALVIGGDGVTLDLNGHIVEGAIVANGRSDLQVLNGVLDGDLQLQRVSRATVRRVRVRNGSITCLHSAGCTILESFVTGGGIAIVQSESGVPNRVRGNTVSAAPGAGITASRTDTTSITANVVRNSGTGIETSHAADLRIARNLILGNTGDGLSGSFGAAAAIVRNVIGSNGGDGISLRNWGGQTLIARNVASHNGRNGILGRVVGHWAVVNNVADRNGEAGIVITGAVDDATVAGNRARRNRGLGIDLVPAVTDGGANAASGNGAPEQCAGVVCR